MASLASFLSTLSPLLGRSVAALYERQRALVRMGVLPKASGRGRSSGGATATPNTVAWLLVSLLATDHLSEVPRETELLANAKIDDNVFPPFPSDASFVQAIAHVLANPAVAERITHFQVSRGSPNAGIGWIIGKGADATIGHADFRAEREPIAPGLAVRASVNAADVIRPIAKLLSERG